MNNKGIIRKLRSVELCMTAHPDCEKGSEFEDRIIDLQEIQKALLKPFNCINKKDGFKKCKEQCSYCSRVNGF